MNENSTKKKIRIVNKSKESITIDIRNAGGIIKMSWNIFKSLFDICEEDTKFCYTKEDNNATYVKFRRLLNRAVDSFSKIKDVENPDKKYLETLGKCYNDLIMLLNCTKEDLNKLVIDKYNEVIKQQEQDSKNKDTKKKQLKRNNYQKEKQIKEKSQPKQQNYTKNIPTIPVSTFGDLDELKQLKEKLDDKRGS